MSAFLYRLGSLCARMRFLVLGTWLLLAAGLVLCLTTFGAVTNNDLTLPGTGSQQATDLLEAEFPPQQNGGSPIVFHVAKGDVASGANGTAVKQSVAAILEVPHVYSAPDPTTQAGLVSDDGHTAFSSVLMDIGTAEITPELAQRVVDAAKPATKAGIQVEAGGPIGGVLSPSDEGSSEAIGLLAAVVILTFTFGSLVAMGMPIGMAVLGLAVALGIVGMLGHVFKIASAGPTLATMIGLGVGIDYALFLVTRHRDNLREGMPVHASVATAVATSGSAVVFAGSTVVIALLALGVAGIPLVTSLGIATAIAVVVAVLAAITLLPAMLATAGTRINSLALPAWLHPQPKPEGQGLWAGWARWVSGHKWTAVLIALAILVPLALPVSQLALGQEDIGVTPEDTTERKAFDLLSDGFGPGYNGVFVVAVELKPAAAASPQYLAEYQQATAMKDSLSQQQTELTDQADALQKQQKQLEKQQAALEQQGDELKAEQAALLRQQTALERQAAQLQAQAAALRNRAADLRAERRAEVRDRRALRREARRLAVVLRRLEARKDTLTADLAALDDQIAAATPEEKVGLLARRALAERAVAAVQRAIGADRSRLRTVETQARAARRQAADLARQAASLARQAVALGQEADQLAAQATSLEQQGAALQQQADDLNAQAADLQAQADELQQQADDLRARQAAALAEQGQAEQLQSQITAELTKAGGNEVATDPRLTRLQDALSSAVGVQLVGPPNVSKSGTAATFTVIPTTRPADPATAALVVQLRDKTIPPAAGAGVTAFVGGNTAANVDLADKITKQLPLVILTIIGLSFLLLMVAFRSLLIPVQAAITNLLSAGAAFGVMTVCFQWGWGLSITGPDSPYGTVPIASYVPLMMFAALFGLSMDYEVFFVSHLQHVHAAGAPVTESVRRGLAASAKVIVAAAAIMMSVFGSFILSSDPIIKQFGVGLSVAVFLAGLMVILLAPALLLVFGERTFWVPAWLGKVLPHLDLEGPPPSVPAPRAPADEREPVVDVERPAPMRAD
jgi:uncharacterized membrane protein YdfJ with MMPL/SSD domain